MANSNRLVIAVATLWAGGFAALFIQPLAADSLADRQAKLAALPADAQQQLLVKFERFRQLPAAEKQRLHELHRAIETDPARDELLATLDRYSEWLQTLSAAQRAELAHLLSAERIERVRQLMQERRGPLFPSYRPLSPEDREVVRAWIEKQALANLPADRRAEFDQLSDEERRRALMRAFMQRFQPFDQQRRPTLAGLGEVVSLIDQLSEPVRNEFVRAEPAQKVGILSGWVMQSIGMSITEQQLRKHFDHDLSPAEQQRLLALPGDEMQRELRRMYFRAKGNELGLPRFDMGRPQPPPGGFPPGRGGPFKERGKEKVSK
ncbi:MAG: hypothetical protein JNM18_23790 [Planctomycetaceae bacterium]|nr:hypothetical protein [Planctomycetaceae bacterium]